MGLIQQFLNQCNALLVIISFDDVLLDIQRTLSQALQDLDVCSYQQSHVMGMKHELHDCNCQPDRNFHGFHASHTRMNVVCLEIDGTLNTNPQVIVDNCVNHFTTLLGQACSLHDDVRQSYQCYLN